MSDFSISVDQFNQNFMQPLDHVDAGFKNFTLTKPTPWVNLISRGMRPNGQGFERKLWRWYNDPGTQVGRAGWRPIQPSRTASATDNGYNACTVAPESVSYGMNQIAYTGFKKERKTDPICIEDISNASDMQGQLEAIYKMLPYITYMEWYTIAREEYLRFCVRAERAYVLSADYGKPTSVGFDYDGTTPDADGDFIVTVPSGTNFDLLNFDKLDYFKQMLAADVGLLGAVATDSGEEIYGLQFDPQDFYDAVIGADAATREDFRQANLNRVTVEHMGDMKNFRGWALMGDKSSYRLKIKSDDGTNISFKIVKPQVNDQTAITIGYKTERNPEFIDAEYGIGFCFIKDVYKMMIAEGHPTNAGGGMTFGPSKGNNGTWQWINNRTDSNPLGKVGYYLAEFGYFPEPGDNDEYPIAFIYKRCVDKPSLTCASGDTAVVGASVGLASDAVTADVDTDNNTVTLTLTDKLFRDNGPVTVTDDDDVAITGVIADASSAPTYTFALVSAPGAFGKYTKAGAAVVALA